MYGHVCHGYFYFLIPSPDDWNRALSYISYIYSFACFWPSYVVAYFASWPLVLFFCFYIQIDITSDRIIDIRNTAYKTVGKFYPCNSAAAFYNLSDVFFFHIFTFNLLFFSYLWPRVATAGLSVYRKYFRALYAYYNMLKK